MGEARVHYIERDNGQWDFDVVGGNGEKVHGGQQRFRDTTDAERGFGDFAAVVAEAAANDPVVIRKPEDVELDGD